MSAVEALPAKVRDFVQSHGLSVLRYPYAEATDELLRQRRSVFGEYALFAGGIVEEAGRIVLVQEHMGPDLDGGVWKLPGGGVRREESIPAAAIREIKEETGLDVKLLRPLAVVKTGRRAPTAGTIDAFFVFFSARVVGGRLLPGDPDIAQVSWATFEEIEEFIAHGTYGSRLHPFYRAGEIACLRRWAATRRPTAPDDGQRDATPA